MVYVTELRYSRSWIHDLRADLATLEPATSATERGEVDAVRFSRTLTLEGVSYTYVGEREPVLLGVDLTIARGESVGIVGSSGAGKSTLGHTGRTIVGLDPKQTPVPLAALKRLRLVHESSDIPPAVRIFEYLGFRRG
jgi:ABC-type transport system involved in cytochrome bd biosynthesis fused ATPase/permease subunit